MITQLPIDYERLLTYFLEDCEVIKDEPHEVLSFEYLQKLIGEFINHTFDTDDSGDRPEKETLEKFADILFSSGHTRDDQLMLIEEVAVGCCPGAVVIRKGTLFKFPLIYLRLL